jgi:glyoxylase-like metal-dependent hydrolase (beta-lactamase superfamily II)
MKTLSTCNALAALLTVFAAAPAAAHGHWPQDSFICAHRLLADAIAAAGGEAAVAGVSRIAGRAEGESRNAYQQFEAAHVDDPKVDGRIDTEFAFDFARGRFRQQGWQRLRGGFDLGFAALVTGTQVTTLRLAERSWTRSNAPTPEAAAAQAVDIPARLLPPLLLRRARENFASLRCNGEGSAFEFSWDARTRISVALDGTTNRVSEASVLQPDVLDGEALAYWRYSGEQRVGGLAFPRRVQVVRRGAALFDVALSELRVNTPLDDALFAVPADFTPVPDAAPGLTVAAVAEGLWEVRGIAGGTYRTPVVETADFLVAFDAPLSAPVTRQVIAQLRQRFPNKPVRYVVLSHFHSDHSAGLPAYAELGATIVVTPSDRAFVERLLATRSRLALPLIAPLTSPRAATLLAIDDERVLPGAPGVRAIRLRGSAHVADTLVLHHAASRAVIEGDLFGTLTPFNAVYAWFADWLAASPLEPRLVSGIHHEPVEVARIVELAKGWRARR